jgi:hypothetical protein
MQDVTNLLNFVARPHVMVLSMFAMAAIGYVIGSIGL